MDEQKKNALTAEADGVIEGRNAVIEALRAGERSIEHPAKGRDG